MRERDIQDYLFEHPNVLFPGKVIQEKRREFTIQGKRIDLLFVVDGVQYIVEVKAHPIKRADIGQIVEYYGLMKEFLRKTSLRMILVAPSIPKWRSTLLEELGIRCIELPEIPSSKIVESDLIRKAKTSSKRQAELDEIESILDTNDKLSRDDISSEITPRKVSLVRRIVKDSLPFLLKQFNEYEIVPYMIDRAFSPDRYLEFDAALNYGKKAFVNGGVWFAFRFGHSDKMPPNDVPNISVLLNDYGCDITVNAEIQPAQRVLVEKIRRDGSRFYALLASDSKLWLKTYLKYAHQPRFFYWILTDLKPPSQFDSDTILRSYELHESKFDQERDYWLSYIQQHDTQLTPRQTQHLVNRNCSLNLAIRLSHTIHHDDAMWDRLYQEQLLRINEVMSGLKPLIHFFVE